MTYHRLPLKAFLLQICCMLAVVQAFVAITAFALPVEQSEDRVCIGSSDGLAAVDRNQNKLDLLRHRFSGCETVDGNLEITHFNDDDIAEIDNPFDFLSSIKYVMNTVIIAYNNFTRDIVLPLSNLTIIWGQSPFHIPGHHFNISLFVQADTFSTIDFRSLRAINFGQALVLDSAACAFYYTVNWMQLLGFDFNVASNQPQSCYLKQSFQCSDRCPKLNKQSYCWGPGDDQCQIIYRDKHCAKWDSMSSDLCCHEECVGGCTGPGQDSCIACRNFRSQSRCVQVCPSKTRYLPNLQQTVDNPHGKLMYLKRCVDECPKHLLIEHGACVRECKHGNRESGRECIKCDGNCTKSCKLRNTEHISAENIQEFEKCEEVQGNLIITAASFRQGAFIPTPVTTEVNGKNPPIIRWDSITEQQLELLSSIKRINGYLRIEGTRSFLNSLDFLRNLEQINGRELSDRAYALDIRHTELKSLNFPKLKRIENGGVLIAENDNLCYIHNIPWQKIVDQSSKKIIIHVAHNREEKFCFEDGHRCHPACNASEGCWGWSERQCFSCQAWQVDDMCSLNCSINDGHYSVLSGICKECHPMCATCNGSEIDNCLSCKYKKNDGKCVKDCPTDTFIDDGVCQPCSNVCSNCTGPGNTLDVGGCSSCNHGIYDSEKNVRCVLKCPDDMPFSHADKICHSNKPEKPIALLVVIAPIIFVFLLIVLILVVVTIILQRRAKAASYLKSVEMPMEPNPDAKPNLSKLILINETELRRGSELGNGAFGTVFKGVWSPAGQASVKIAVAIKVLHESVNEEIAVIEEAGCMARIQHPHLLRIFMLIAFRLLGVCIAQQVQLVTPLMPLGNLLEYIHRHNSRLNSAALLRWCLQICSGMKYLEENRLVHCDLAARNVLVRLPHHVVITDFGLSKLLDFDEESYTATGGKMPVKWLALECIQHRRFTHKSDVWAFGVTVWEILTFGEKPYKDIPVIEVVDLLQKGERLPQPPNCTLDLYMVLIKCWMTDADSRPSFATLYDIFRRFCKDPPRYLVIEGDKLLRLPSFSPADRKELICEMVGDESLIEFDDYIPNTTDSPPNLDSPTNASKLFSLEEDLRADASSTRLQGVVFRSRYASDPSKSVAQNKPDACSVAVDADDYLLPNTRLSHIRNASAIPDFYLPLLDDTIDEEYIADEPVEHSYYFDANTNNTAAAVTKGPSCENPEYVESNAQFNEQSALDLYNVC